MAGITNSAFRRLCREYGGGLYVAEMVTSRALVERTPESLRIISHDDDEKVRSVQLYGVDPVTVGQAVRMLVEEDRADHIDLNFGCPVPKVTRRGGGSALPWKIDLFTSIVQTAVKEASKGNVPLTIKMRKGIDEDHLTYLDAGRIARDSGVAAVALHGRTAAQFYSGQADWSAIARLREALPDIPVLGNGDIWSAEDAVRMVRETGCGRRRRRPRLPGPALAVRRPHGRVRRQRRSGTGRTCARWPRASTGTPSSWSRPSATRARPCATSASTSPGTSRATWSAANCGPSWRSCTSLEVLRGTAGPAGPRLARTPASTPRARAAAPARPRSPRCPRTGC